MGLISFLVLIGVLVTVHELGHFLVAKWCGVKVLKFSIGFGPRIFGFTRGETEYVVAWIPLGGFVKMAGELPGEEVEPEDARRSFLGQPPWKRAAIVAAGPAFNLIFPILAYFFVYLGEVQVPSSRVGWVDPDLPAARAGIRPGDVLTKIDGRPIKSFDEIRDALQSAFDKETVVSLKRGDKEMTVTLTPARTVETNPIEKVTRGVIGIHAEPRPPIVGVPESSPAFAAGLRTFDRILTVNGKPVKDDLAFFDLAAKEPEGPLKVQVARSAMVEAPGVMLNVPELIELELQRVAGAEGWAMIGAEPGDLYVWTVLPEIPVRVNGEIAMVPSPAAKAGIKRGDRLVQIGDRPVKSWTTVELELRVHQLEPFEITWSSGGVEKKDKLAQALTVVDDEFKNRTDIPELGIRPRLAYQARRADILAAGPETEKITLHLGPLEAMTASVKIVPFYIGKTALIIGKLFTGDVPLETVGGPIMLFQVAQKSAEAGLEVFIANLALLSINLGLMNLLPIPVLDGFGLLAALWEGIRRRPIPTRARELANMMGLAMLAVLMVIVFKNDITKLLR
jgi:regulator of sigma E protease